MARCQNCNAIIVAGAVKHGSLRWCSNDCRRRSATRDVATIVPDAVIDKTVLDIFHGRCPQCKGDGPVDLRSSYVVWSAFLFTRFYNDSKLCCSKCGRINKVKSFFISGIAGWWGFPTGFVVTPVQLVRNLIGLTDADTRDPSAALREFVSIELLHKAAEQGRRTDAAHIDVSQPTTQATAQVVTDQDKEAGRRARDGF